MKKILAALMGLLLANSAHGTQYEITINSTLNVLTYFLPGVETLFGVPNSSIPFHTTFTVNAEGATTIPANTYLAELDGYFEPDVHIIQKSAVSDFSVSAGLTTTWGIEDLFPAYDPLGPSNPGDVVIVGSFSNPIAVHFFVEDTANILLQMSLGSVYCDHVNACIIHESGGVNGPDASATFSGTTVSSVAIEQTPQEQISSLSEVVFSLELDGGTMNSLAAKLGGALDKLDPLATDKPAAKNKLQSFINSVNAIRGKKISQATADDLIAQAQAVIADIQ